MEKINSKGLRSKIRSSEVLKTNNEETGRDVAVGAEPKSKRIDYVSAYKRAELNYKRLREERKNESERQRIEQEKKKEKSEFKKEWRRKKNQILQLRTRKGQPNLNAQIGMILEKLEKDKGNN